MSENTNKFYIILTAIGQAMVAESIRSGEDINLKLVAVGDADYIPTSSQSALINERARVEIIDIIRDEENPAWLRISAILAPDVGGWHIHEVGIFAENGNLFAVGKMDGSYKPIYTDGMCKEVQLDLILEVGGDANINLIIDPHAIIATRKWVIEYIGQWKDKWTAHIEDKNNPHETTIGKIPELREELDKCLPYDITLWDIDFILKLMKKIRVPIWIENDTDWYVDSINGSDDNDGSTPEKAFKTIQASINYVTENFNFSVYTARINVAAGDYIEDILLTKYQASTGEIILTGPASGTQPVIKGSFLTSVGAGVWTLDNLKIQYDGRPSMDTNLYFALRTSTGSKMLLFNVDIECGPIIAQDRYGAAASGGGITIYSGCSFSGHGVQGFLYVSSNGDLLIFGDVTVNGSVITGTAIASSGGSLALDSSVLGRVPQINGTVSGPRAYAYTNGIIQSSGTGAELAFPGTATVPPEAGGQIV